METTHASMEFMDGTQAQYLQDLKPGQRCRFGFGGCGIGRDGECVGPNASESGWLIRQLDDHRLYDVRGSSWIIPLVEDEHGNLVGARPGGGTFKLPKRDESAAPRRAYRRRTEVPVTEERETPKAKPKPAHTDHGEDIANAVDEELKNEEG